MFKDGKTSLSTSLIKIGRKEPKIKCLSFEFTNRVRVGRKQELVDKYLISTDERERPNPRPHEKCIDPPIVPADSQVVLSINESPRVAAIES